MTNAFRAHDGLCRADSPEGLPPLRTRRDTLRALGGQALRLARTLGVVAAGVPFGRSAGITSASAHAPTNMTPSAPKTRGSERLPRTCRPARYDLTLVPDLEQGTFEGTVVITVQLRRPTRTLWLHAAELDITHAAVTRPNGATHHPKILLDPTLERCSLSLPQALPGGEWTVRLSFRGQLNEQLRGFYLSTYTDTQGATQRLAVTQFEAADARRAFPCWDEPDFKAVFALTLHLDPSMTAVSNTRVLADTQEGGKRVLQFAETIVMSTYLLAFVVGHLEATEPSYAGATPVRVWTVPGKSHLARYGQEWAAFSLRFFEDYYGIPYPGDKLDLIAIPDFSYGAMENLGAVTFRESALLVDPATATHGDLQGLADVVSHENAHMWFGDLVTMAWWNGLWLNEAFATFLEVVAVDAWKPEWRRWDQFALSRAGALSTDGLFASRAIEFPVRAVKDLGAMFDVLTYQKGAAVLRMLEQFLGTPVFREGIRRYLRKHAYANAETHDLWAALADASGQSVGDIMHEWVFSPGYPLLTVSTTTDGHLRIRQQRFTYLKAPLTRADAPRKTTTRWHVPLELAITGAQGTTTHRLLVNANVVRYPLPQGADTVLLNPGGHGYFRVHYAPELRQRLLAAFPDGLAAIDRFNLVSDSWATCMAGLAPLREYVDLSEYAARDRSPQTWSVLLTSFERLESILDLDDRPRFEAWVRTRLEPILSDLGWSPREGESDLTRELRGDLIEAMAILGNHPETQAEAARRYAAYLQDAAAVDPNLVPALVAIAAWTGDESVYEAFVTRFRQAATPQEERRYLFGLAGFRSPALVARTLRSTLNGEIRTQDAASILGALLSTRHGHDQAWQFLVEHWPAMAQRWPSNGLRRLFGHLATRATRPREQDIHRFVEQHRVDLGGKALAQALEHLRIAVVFREQHQAAFRTYLQSAGSSAPGF